MVTEALNKPTQGQDSFGNYSICTGHEGSGTCFWCGGPFPDKRHRRFCCEGCRQEYNRHFVWPSAKAWCRKRANYKCADCGMEHRKPPDWVRLVVHHIIPLEGKKRVCNKLNHPNNLVLLCPSCHGKRHAEMRKRAKQEPPTLNFPSRLHRNGHTCYLTNSDVAWLIGDRRLATYYSNGVYLPPIGWFVCQFDYVEGWEVGACAELRRPISVEVAV